MSGQSTSTATTGTLGWLDANFGDWVPCANYTVEWRGGKEPYALEPLVNYRNGSSALGVARPNLFTDSYDYFSKSRVCFSGTAEYRTSSRSQFCGGDGAVVEAHRRVRKLRGLR